MPKVLLLNPPASQRVCRDLYCGHVAKGSYYWPQIDLLVLSGWAHQAGCELKLLDAVVDGMTAAQAARIVDAFVPPPQRITPLIRDRRRASASTILTLPGSPKMAKLELSTPRRLACGLRFAFPRAGSYAGAV